MDLNNLVINNSVNAEDLKKSLLNSIPKINLLPHTVFILCGPTMCGKSQFAEDLQAAADKHDLSAKRISSDEIRTRLLRQSNLLDDYGGRHTRAMHASSGPAFEILMAELKASVTYPINTEIVIVDTTGMDERFRSEVIKIAKANEYRTCLVTFEYKYASDYLPPGKKLKPETEEIVKSSVSRFRREVLPSIKRRDYDDRLRITSRTQFGFDLIPSQPITEENKDLQEFVSDPEFFFLWEHNCVTDEVKKKLEWYDDLQHAYIRTLEEQTDEPVADLVAVIGDSHECVEELKQLISNVQAKYPKIRFVHIGDYLNKGGQTREMVEYMYSRLEAGDTVVIGNHENYVYKRVTEQIEGDKEFEQKYGTSIPVLMADQELKKKFLEIFSASVPFLILNRYPKVRGDTPVFITHAPCRNKELGKITEYCLRAQRNYRRIDRSIPEQQELEWFYKEANYSHPLHIVGHVPNKVTDPKGYRYKNKVFLDTGAVHGHQLTAAIVDGSVIKEFISVPAKKVRMENTFGSNLGLGPLIVDKELTLDSFNLDPRDYRQINAVVKNEVKYISGTMAPAPSKPDTLEIESMAAGLKWLAEKHKVDQVIIEPKHMGSRAQLYLFKDAPEKTMMTSRNGWVIRRLEDVKPEAFEAFKLDLFKKFEFLVKKGDVIIDGELMPWKMLGKELITKEFLPYQNLVEDELKQLLASPGFQALPFSQIYNVNARLEDLEKFKDVLQIFGGDAEQEVEPFFEGFDILKWNNPSVKLDELSTMDRYCLASSNPFVVLDLSDDKFEASLKEAEEFFRQLVNNHKMEGVVVKPMRIVEGTLPYIKVRSEEYLRLVYGYDYTGSRLESLCQQKKIGYKAQVSLAEAKLGRQMLECVDEDSMKILVARMISEIKKEKELDPRL